MAERKPVLRRGWSTGACAAAAARAAFEALVSGHFPDPVTIALPGGERPRFPLALKERDNGMARAGIVKDAGDDPDVTHGAMVIAELTRAAHGAGIRFRAGDGVGTVTLARSAARGGRARDQSPSARHDRQQRSTSSSATPMSR